MLSELNRFTINSDYHNHNDTGRQALRDDGITMNNHYRLRSAGGSTATPVADVRTDGLRASNAAYHVVFGIRPALTINTKYLTKPPIIIIII